MTSPASPLPGPEEHRCRLVVFDFDGTLADSFPWFLTAYAEAAARYGLRPIDREEADALRRCGPREIVRRLGVPWWKMPFIARHMRRRMSREIEKIGLFPGVAEMMRQLSAGGHILAIATSNTRVNVDAVIGNPDIALIEHYACDISLLGKHRVLRRMLRRTGIPASEAIYIGDEIRDIEAARAAGMRAGAVSWGYGDAETLRSRAPDLFFEQVPDIPATLSHP